VDRRDFIRQLGSAAAVASLPVAVAQKPKPPNFVFILADDLGWTDLGVYGSDLNETPNLDRLAQQGVRFDNAYAACPVCSPTRASIMTGKYPAKLKLTNYLPGTHPVPYSKLIGVEPIQYLPLEEVTIAEKLKTAGYVSGHIGKWHLGGKGFEPEKQGFDDAFAFASGGVRGFFYPNWKQADGSIEGKDGEYITDRLTDEAVKFLQTNKDRPFFLYLPHFSPHLPIEAKEKTVAKYKAKLKPGLRHSDPEYAAMIDSLDEGIGRVLKTLDELKLAENTYVIFTSDNGGLTAPEWKLKPVTSNAPLREGKGHVYEGGVRVPLIIRGPGVRKNQIEHTPVISVDYFPTLNELAGLPVSASSKVDGETFAPLLKAAKKTTERDLFWHYPHYSNQLGRPASAIRQGDWKLIRFHEDGHLELYNLRKDPGEKTNLADASPDKAKKLATRLEDWLKTVHADFPQPNPKYDAKREGEGYWWKAPNAFDRFKK
jgi:arylsulfatase A